MYVYLEQIESEECNIIKGLQLVQQREGYVSEAALEYCADYFNISLARVEGIVSFYAQFKRNRPGKYQISACDGTACHIKGTPLIVDWIETEIGIGVGQTSGDGLFSLETVACLGCCSLAPVLAVNGEIHGNLDRKALLKLLKRMVREEKKRDGN